MSDDKLPPPNLGPDANLAGNLSASSSNSSFVPIDNQVVDAIQVIDEDKQFNTQLIDYIEKASLNKNIGDKYHIVSVFGSQSTGKSTLLNRLFNTNFDVMDETKRQQTTKGIWMAYSPVISSTIDKKGQDRAENIFVMDVEGTDGRERGEDQDFERKAALFALATSEILIINTWETQIGLYQGANMGLLKTVFEVNLSLFGKSKLQKNDDHKVLLLFVIRDHLGVTPLDNLANTITQDLQKMWDDLNKPQELIHLEFDQLFDLKFHTLSHKVLQEDQFNDDVKKLGNKFIDPSHDEFLWLDNYHHDIPIDGWTMYAENCWKQIDSNKDLDLPTQQVLVAKFKCDEILNSLYEEFIVKFNSLLIVQDEPDYKEIGLIMKDIHDEIGEKFYLSASKYNKTIYEQKKIVLEEKVLVKYKDLFDNYGEREINQQVKYFNEEIEKKSDEKFVNKLERLYKTITSQFEINMGYLLGSFNLIMFQDKLNDQLQEASGKQQTIELNAIINRLIKKLNNQLNKIITFELGDLKEETWDNIVEKFKTTMLDLLANYKSGTTYDFGLGIDEDTTKLSIEKIKFKGWVKFYDTVHDKLSKENILTKLKERFDDKFRYDQDGIPRLYKSEGELDESFHVAKAYATQHLDIMTTMKLSDSSEVLADYDIFSPELKAKYDDNKAAATAAAANDVSDDDSDDEEKQPLHFSHIITETEKATVLDKFKKETDVQYIETKRSIVQHVTAIPYYIYILIVVLGWNEFMAIIRSPIFFTLGLLIGGFVYLMYQLNLLRPALTVGRKMVDEALVLAKEKLKDMLDDSQIHAHNMDKMSGSFT